jgi:hypothetical protein
MPTAEECEAMIKGLDYQALRELWRQVQARDTPRWDRGKAFEYLILRAFELEGADVQYPFEVEIQDEVAEQIDGVVHLDFLSAVVESKDHDDSTRVSIGPIAKLRNQLLRRPSPAIGMLFSRTGFTSPAVILCQYLAPQTVLLWQGPEIELALARGRDSTELVEVWSGPRRRYTLLGPDVTRAPPRPLNGLTLSASTTSQRCVC